MKNARDGVLQAILMLLLTGIVVTACQSGGVTSVPRKATPHLGPTSASLPDGVDNVSTWLPLQNGDMWVYRATFYSTGITTTLLMTDTIVDVVEKPGYTIAEVHRDEKIEKVRGVPQSGNSTSDTSIRRVGPARYWWIVSGEKVYLQKGRLDLSNLSEALIELEFPLEIGRKWYLTEERGKFSSASADDWMLRKVVRQGDVAVPAGEFSGCFLMQDAWGDSDHSSWFCPGIGFVKRTVKARGPAEGNVQELVRYRVNR